MKTIYDSLHGRIELNNDLLGKVDAAASEVRRRFSKSGERVSQEFYLGRAPVFDAFSVKTDGLGIRVALSGKNGGTKAVKATLGNYANCWTGTHIPHWETTYLGKNFFETDVRRLPDLLFEENFVRGTYNSPQGLKELGLVRQAHLGSLVNAIFVYAKADAEREHGKSADRDEIAYLKRVYRAAEKASRGGDIRLLREAIKTNPERKIWRSRRSGGGCG